MGIHNGKERVHGMSEEENVQKLIQTPHGVQESIKMDYADFVYAEFYPDKDKLMQLVLDTFYTKQDK